VNATAIALLLGLGWSVRDEQYIRAQDGLGYKLGIIGSSMMLALLAYSARKRIRALSGLGPLASWFRIHMILGLIGPIAILFHANFAVGSANAAIALTATLLVAASGIIGRFVYGQIHWGLYGRRANVLELRKELTETEDMVRPLLSGFPEVLSELDAFEARHTQPPRSAASALARLFMLGPLMRGLRRRALSQLGEVLFEERAATERYLSRLRKLAVFSCYERLFRLWHALHIPFFVVLILAMVVHVVAVHMY
jgi:hypothetical protein